MGSVEMGLLKLGEGQGGWQQRKGGKLCLELKTASYWHSCSSRQGSSCYRAAMGLQMLLFAAMFNFICN